MGNGGAATGEVHRLEPALTRPARWAGVLVRQPAQPRHPIKGSIQADDGGADDFTAVCGQKGPRGTCSPGPLLPDQVDEESRVRDHLRPPDRRPRSLSIRSSTARSTSGGGICSIASNSSPQVSAGLATCLLRTLVKESPGRFKANRRL